MINDLRTASTFGSSTAMPAPLAACLLLVLTLLFASSVASAETITGRVVKVSDGDTITLLVREREQVRVRLGEIDAPENGQPYGRTARRMLADLVAGRQVRVEVSDTDRYGRAVGRIHAGQTDVNAAMVKQGGAWAYRRYLTDQRFIWWENEARKAKRGLWSLQADQIIAPWDWRAAKRAGSNPRPAPVAGASLSSSYNRGYHSAPQTRIARSSAGSCGKRTCSQMSSCEDAMFHLNQCGVSRLDRDGDGVPCESLCR